ncbi:ABC transporter permease [Rathayibacter sp. Leaf296]|uniref:ABC transporter permease n=1 Tax=Rathayibacter sp. Leaf296 TaxID=1736327 RepID=UPI0007024172|nr:ABC transporter permease [Rathayibacter sp. Leaf296]KQQ08613.1 sugar ABC transporter permease [Rathayibacter sp. Leaf296]
MSIQTPLLKDPVITPTGRRPVSSYFGGSAGSFIGLIALFIVLSIVAPNFFTARNLVNVIDQVTVLGILAIGATLVIITGGIDLSVGAILGLSTMVLGWLSHDGGWPLPLAMLAAIAVGGLAGALNGLGITIAKLPPFIATLAMMSIARGLANMITDGQQIVGYPEWFFNLSANRFLGFFSVTIMVVIALYIAAWAYLKYRVGGRSVFAIGGGPEVSRLAGIPVKRVTTWVYVAAGALAGVGGIVLATRLDSSQPTAGTGYELDVIAAVVIGGASLTGGVGRITGTVIGVLIIGFLRNGLNLIGVSPFLQQIVIGLVIAIAVMADVLRRKRA